jgi:hypothetical protein
MLFNLSQLIRLLLLLCTQAPIRCFAVFCGLLITFDYVMCVLLVFPALIVYDRARYRTSCCCRCHACQRHQSVENGEEAHHDLTARELNEEKGDSDENPSLIRRLLLVFYKYLHMFRWPILLICTGAIVVSAIFAAKIEMPVSSDVRLLPSSYEFEKNFEWRKRLLHDVLEKRGGSRAYVIFGVIPADTGDLNDPQKFSQLVLDDSFDPSSKEAQEYLLPLCDRVFAEDWAEPPSADYVCPINRFDGWLKEQAASADPDTIYISHCGGASSVPVLPEFFHGCMYNWGQQVEETNVLARNGIIEIMYFPVSSRVRYDSPYDDLDAEWHLIENWMTDDRRQAPEGANKAYLSSEDFWWYDTNGQMLSAAFSSAGIALGGAAFVILCTSRSFVLTLFATLTIGYVLTTVTATCVAMGWTLGFLESICFAILIGVSCDFVIHFSHAYSFHTGDVSRGERTKHALIEMGPSILAGAFTTVAGAILMIFTVITFFRKFAIILFLTVVQATAGSFVVFLSMTDCLGPSDPTALVDKALSKCSKKGERNDDSNSKPTES